MTTSSARSPATSDDSDVGPSLDQHARKTLRRQHLEELVEIDAGGRFVHFDEAHARFAERVLPLVRRGRPDRSDQRHLTRRIVTRFDIERQARAGVEDDADRRSRGKAGEADGETRIVDQRRADADHRRIGLDAHRLHGLERGAAADDHALALAPADHPVGGDGELEDDMRPVLGDAGDMPGMGKRRLVGEQIGGHRDAGGLEPRNAATIHPRVGIGHRHDDARDPRRDQRVGARRRVALVRARFQRDVKGRAARRRAGLRQRQRLGMRAAAFGGPAAADDDRLARLVARDHDRAHGRIGIGATEVAPAETQRRSHEPAIQFAIDLGRDARSSD